MKKMWTVVVTAVFLVATWWGSTSAQTGWLNPEGKPGIGVEWSFASIKDYAGYAYGYKRSYPFPTGAIFLSARGNISPSFQFVAEIPIFLSKYEISNWMGSVSESKNGLANPYIGIEYSRPGTSPTAAFGMRIPILSESNAGAAALGTLHESHRFMAFAHKVMQLSVNAGYRYVTAEGSGFRFTGGGQLGIPNEGDAELFGDLTTNFWIRARQFRLMGAFGGLVWITESGVDFGDRLLLNLGFAADVTLGSWQPGVHIHFPLDNTVKDIVSSDYGIHLTYLLPKAKK